MKENRKELIQNMTLEEKASLCSGFSYWDTKEVKRLGIQSFRMTDGPNGVRLQTGEEDRFGLNDSVRATCFPTGSCLASSWNEELLEEVGSAIGKEARDKKISVVLGPAINIKRSPLCGRNFEYLSEDPILTGKLGAAYVRGMQKEGVGATPKHFAVNNQERLRQTIDARVDERTLREIYLKAFEIVVKESAPWMLMTSYNKVNGEFASQNEVLLKKILREEWKYQGLTVTDWFGSNERWRGVAAGQDLEMPGNGGITDEEIVEAVRDGRLSEKAVDICVEHYLTLYEQIQEAEKGKYTAADYGESHRTAKKAALEGAVLLKNEEHILPVSEKKTVALIGEFAKEPRFQGGGSSHLNANQMDTVYESLRSQMEEKHLIYAEGYQADQDEADEKRIREAVAAAKEADIVVIVCGLTESFESEGFDRETMRMPAAHIRLIEEVTRVNPDVVVVMQNGAPVEMSWESQVKGILECYLGGEAGGSAVADLLLGKENPSGKLAETFPLCLSDNPSYLNFPGTKETVEYQEGIFVGYRYYCSKKQPVRYPFGYGLSYTTFAFSDFKIDCTDGQNISAQVTVRNTGKMAGKEVVQLYVKAPAEYRIRPALELKGFYKVSLEAGEEKRIKITAEDLSCFDMEQKTWTREQGEYIFYIGNSCENLPLQQKVWISGTERKKHYDQNTLLGELLTHEIAGEWAEMTRKRFMAIFTAGNAKPATKRLLEKSTVEQPLRVLLCSGLLDKEKLKTLLMVLNGEDYSGRDTAWLTDSAG